jgi:hypothetical protein
LILGKPVGVETHTGCQIKGNVAENKDILLYL